MCVFVCAVSLLFYVLGSCPLVWFSIQAFMVNQVVWPYRTGEVIVQNYNAVLTLSHLYQTADAIIVMENDELHKICSQLLGIKVSNSSYSYIRPMMWVVEVAGTISLHHYSMHLRNYYKIARVINFYESLQFQGFMMYLMNMKQTV